MCVRTLMCLRIFICVRSKFARVTYTEAISIVSQAAADGKVTFVEVRVYTTYIDIYVSLYFFVCLQGYLVL